ncbi:hypothetical protein DFP72DRAFT_57752 [Ephemerocybe angulata]|uniref:Uncharacterized protein n=1 Tax=Ephemerocybe angulata TaxID=980116 RepID=A0A8H6MAD4_9AGAR|nr:hypothetical protein DFP72DRAFT_57752 [Tulosesus angulatus]
MLVLHSCMLAPRIHTRRLGASMHVHGPSRSTLGVGVVHSSLVLELVAWWLHTRALFWWWYVGRGLLWRLAPVLFHSLTSRYQLCYSVMRCVLVHKVVDVRPAMDGFASRVSCRGLRDRPWMCKGPTSSSPPPFLLILVFPTLLCSPSLFYTTSTSNNNAPSLLSLRISTPYPAWLLKGICEGMDSQINRQRPSLVTLSAPHTRAVRTPA